MKYILENVKKIENNHLKRISFLVEDSQISYVNQQMKRLKYLRINTDGFYLKSGFIMNDFSLGQETNFFRFKERIKRLINKGCTTVVTYSEITSERQFAECLRKTRHNMINSSIDYVIGIKVQSKIVSPSLIRKCHREKIAIILIEFDSFEQLENIIWQRVKEVMLTYQPVIVPMIKESESSIENQWKKLAISQKIPTYIPFPSSHKNFDKNLCKLIGLYPKKGELLVGSDVDYILYKEDQHSSELQPSIVVLRGKVLKVDNQVHYHPGYGREVKIKVPGHFIPIEIASY